MIKSFVRLMRLDDAQRLLNVLDDLDGILCSLALTQQSDKMLHSFEMIRRILDDISPVVLRFFSLTEEDQCCSEI